MKLAELSENYPRSIYLLNIKTKEYTLIKEQQNAFLEIASLSPDKKYLLYSVYDLGDPAFFFMNMDTRESFGITGAPIGGAISAKWADNENIIGTAYSGGAYLADKSGNISIIDELKDEALFLVEKVNNDIYYNTQSDGSLMKLDLNTNEKVKLGIDRVVALYPSPDGKQMLILQADDSKNILLTYNPESGESISIAEGLELSGVSWSPDQRFITYNLSENINNIATGSFYVYDLLTGDTTHLTSYIKNTRTVWSPSGKKLILTEWFGTFYNSTIIYLK